MLILHFLNEVLSIAILSFSQLVPLAFEPFPVIILGGITQVLNAFVGLPFTVIEGFIIFPFFYFVFLGLFLAGKLLLCLRFTRTVTMAVYGKIEKTVCMLMVGYASFCCINKIFCLCKKNRMLFAYYFGENGDLAIVIFMVVSSVVITMIAIGVELISMRTMYFIQIAQLPISYIPFSSFFFEVIRTIVVCILFLCNFLFPRISVAFSLLFVIVSMIFYEIQERHIGFFNFEYASQFFPYLYRNKTEKQIMKKFQQVSEKEEDEVWVVSYPVLLEKNNHLPFHKYEKWYLCIRQKHLAFYRNNKKTKEMESVIFEKEDYEFFFQKNEQYLEIFVLDGPKENLIRLFKKPNKRLSFVISYQNQNRLSEIIHKSGAIDCMKYKTYLTKELRKKRIENNQGGFGIWQ